MGDIYVTDSMFVVYKTSGVPKSVLLCDLDKGRVVYLCIIFESMLIPFKNDTQVYY